MENEELANRDQLAKERTDLASERTFLAYVRTAASLIVLGVALAHFLTDVVSQAFGWAAVAAGFLILAIGFWRFKRRTR